MYRVWEIGKLYGSGGTSVLLGLFFMPLKALALNPTSTISGSDIHLFLNWFLYIFVSVHDRIETSSATKGIAKK